MDAHIYHCAVAVPVDRNVINFETNNQKKSKILVHWKLHVSVRHELQRKQTKSENIHEKYYEKIHNE